MRALGRMSAMTNYALFCQSRKANEKPYALYAPLLGVGVFSAFFLLRELHTVHTTAYGSHWNPALALLPVGIEASSARRKQKAHTDPHTDFADFRRNRPPMKLIRLCPSLIPIDARAGFCPWKRFFGPSDGLSSFWGIVLSPSDPHRAAGGRQGFDFQAMTSTEIKKTARKRDCLPARLHTADGNATRRSAGHSSAAGNQHPPIRPFGDKDGQWIPMEESSPSSQFLHFYASVCTSYAAVCSPYALFRLEQEARRE